MIQRSDWSLTFIRFGGSLKSHFERPMRQCQQRIKWSRARWLPFVYFVSAPRASTTVWSTFCKTWSMYFAHFFGVTFLSQNFFIQFTSSCLLLSLTLTRSRTWVHATRFHGFKVRILQGDCATNWTFFLKESLRLPTRG